MKIALYYPWIYLKSGVERTILETVKRSKHDFVIYTNHYDREKTYPEFKKLKVVELKRVPVKRDLFSVLKAAIIIATQKIGLSPFAKHHDRKVVGASSDFDLLLIHSDGLGDLILLRNLLPFTIYHLPIVCYCHTPLRPVYDKYYRDFTLSGTSFTYRLAFNLFSVVFKFLDQKLWEKFHFVFFNSMETKKRASDGGLLKKLKERYEILSPGVDTEKIKPSRIFKSYFFLPGRIMWTKNIELAIKSFIIFKSAVNYKNFKLIVAGQLDTKSKDYYKKLKRMAENRKDIEFVINPSDVKMNRLYASCSVVLGSAFNEDFGMTLVEGNAWGKPVIAANRGGFTESQINGKTGFLVNPTKESFSDAMIKLVNNPEKIKKMGYCARANVKKYDWKYFIKTFDEKIDRLISEKSNY